jgi:hypothetical protein
MNPDEMTPEELTLSEDRDTDTLTPEDAGTLKGTSSPEPEDAIVETIEETASETDTETETVKESAAPAETTDTETETVEDDPYLATFKELELGNRFSTPLEALRGVKDQNRFIDALLKDRADKDRRLLELEARVNKPEEKAFEPEYLSVEALAEMEKAGFVRTDKVAELENRLNSAEYRSGLSDAATIIESADPELRAVASAIRLGQGENFPRGRVPLWDAVQDFVHANPGLDRLPLQTILSVSLPVARIKAPQNGKPKVNPVPQTKKQLARTTTAQKPTGSEQPPDFNKMSPEAQYQWYERKGLVGT